MKYLLTYISPSIILFSLYLGGYWVFMPVLYVFGLVPFLELFFNGTHKNMTELEESIALENKFYDLIIWSMVPFQYVILFFFLNKIGDDSLLGWEKIGMMTGLGVTCGALGINAAHELGHRNTWYEQLMSKMLLLTSLYMHFCIYLGTCHSIAFPVEDVA